MPENAFLDHLLAELHHAYQETGNPVFVWLAIDDCSDKYWPRTEIPAWCAEYLYDAASKLAMLTNEMIAGALRSEGERSRTRVLAALDLGHRGKNHFRNAASAISKMRAAKGYHLDRATGRTAAEALAKVKQEAGLGLSDDRSAFALVAKGVKLSTGRQAPRRRSGKRSVLKPTPEVQA